MKHSIAWIALFLALGTSASGQITKSGKGYLFRVKFAAGSTVKYKTVIGVTLSGRPVKFETPMVRKVVAVHKNSEDILVSQGPLRFNGKAMGSVAKLRMSIDRLGQVIKGAASSNTGVTKFPASPIRPGALWSASLPISMSAFAGNAPTALALYHFIKLTTYNGLPAAELSVSITEPAARMPLSGSGTIYILASDGNILHTSMRFSVQTSPDMAPASVTAEVSRG